jgi:hypothetical protein
LGDQTWQLTLTVFYRPGISQPFPDLGEILQQGSATVWQDSARSAPGGSYTLQFGQELVLRSRDSVTGRELSVLLVTSAQSPL